MNPYTTSEDIRCKTCDGTAHDDWFTKLRLCDGCRKDEDLCDCAEEDDLSVFDDSPNVGLGSDGQYHNDPYCATIAPLGSYEAQHGEVCGYCEKRQKENAEAYFDARFDARLEAAARMDRAFWGLDR